MPLWFEPRFTVRLPAGVRSLSGVEAPGKAATGQKKKRIKMRTTFQIIAFSVSLLFSFQSQALEVAPRSSNETRMKKRKLGNLEVSAMLSKFGHIDPFVEPIINQRL